MTLPDKAPRASLRRVLPALGLVSAAISLAGPQFSVAKIAPALPSEPPAMTVEMMAKDATLLHHARALGIGDALRETGVIFDAELQEKTVAVSQAVAEGRNPSTEVKIDMAYSDGYLDGSEGSWSVERLDAYIDRIFGAEVGFREISDQSFLRWKGQLGEEETRNMVSGTIALTVADFPEDVILATSLMSKPERFELFTSVSATVKGILDGLNDAAYFPPILESSPDCRTDPEVDVCQMQL